MSLDNHRPVARSGRATEVRAVTSTELAGVRVLRTFDGLEPSPGVLSAIGRGQASGVTLFRGRNIDSPAQLRALGAALQAARPAGDPPLLLGLDQEGGQLQAVGEGATAWPGNLALGAADSDDLARRTGQAIGQEVAAMGGTLVFAPVCDVLHPVSATALGTRSFGDDPVRVAGLAAAMTAGLQEAGVAATLKHFPGHGSAAGDSHQTLPVLRCNLATLRRRELPPFRAAIAAGAMAVMPGHLAVPALTGGSEIPATVSRAILKDLLRDELGFAGVVISDALDMAGGAYGSGLADAVCSAAQAGIDLLLLKHAPSVEEAAFETLRSAIASGRLERPLAEAARARILRLRAHFETLAQPPLEVVGCAEHRRLARQVAEASVTLVRDPDRALPLAAGSEGHVAVISPVPADLTPAETSSHLRIGLASALRVRGLAVDAFTVPLDPAPDEVAALVAATRSHASVVACTYDAVRFPGQLALLAGLAGPHADVADRRPVVMVALRSPYDAAAVPEWIASICTYGVQPPQIDALADALLGRVGFAGRLPVRLEALV